MELIETQYDSLLKQKYTEVAMPEFYTYLPADRFPSVVFRCSYTGYVFSDAVDFFMDYECNSISLAFAIISQHLSDSFPNLAILFHICIF